MGSPRFLSWCSVHHLQQGQEGRASSCRGPTSPLMFPLPEHMAEGSGCTRLSPTRAQRRRARDTDAALDHGALEQHPSVLSRGSALGSWEELHSGDVCPGVCLLCQMGKALCPQPSTPPAPMRCQPWVPCYKAASSSHLQLGLMT